MHIKDSSRYFPVGEEGGSDSVNNITVAVCTVDNSKQLTISGLTMTIASVVWKIVVGWHGGVAVPMLAGGNRGRNVLTGCSRGLIVRFNFRHVSRSAQTTKVCNMAMRVNRSIAIGSVAMSIMMAGRNRCRNVLTCSCRGIMVRCNGRNISRSRHATKVVSRSITRVVTRVVVDWRISISKTVMTSVGTVWHSEDLGRSSIAAHVHRLIRLKQKT